MKSAERCPRRLKQRSWQEESNAMRRREIFLDFTSLLDVVLIILFFFILFSHMEIVENKAFVEAQMEEAEAITERANDKMQEAEAMVEQLEEELDRLRQSSSRRAENAEAMMEYDRGHNIKMLLKQNEGAWCLNIVQKEELVESIPTNSDVAQGILLVLNDLGYEPADTIICEFIFDGSLGGTNAAHGATSDAIATVRKTYTNLYCSETDTSIGEE